MNQGPVLSPEEIEKIKMRCEQATAGPWKSYVEGRDEMSGSDFIMTRDDDIYISGATAADQDFIAHARQDIPKLIEEIERLRAQLDSFRNSRSALGIAQMPPATNIEVP